MSSRLSSLITRKRQGGYLTFFASCGRHGGEELNFERCWADVFTALMRVGSSPSMALESGVLQPLQTIQGQTTGLVGSIVAHTLLTECELWEVSSPMFAPNPFCFVPVLGILSWSFFVRSGSSPLRRSLALLPACIMHA